MKHSFSSAFQSPKIAKLYKDWILTINYMLSYVLNADICSLKYVLSAESFPP